jgi:hypothetical protein
MIFWHLKKIAFRFRVISKPNISKITKIDFHRFKYLKKKERLGKKADIEDQELDKWMDSIIQKFPNAGKNVFSF